MSRKPQEFIDELHEMISHLSNPVTYQQCAFLYDLAQCLEPWAKQEHEHETHRSVLKLWQDKAIALKFMLANLENTSRLGFKFARDCEEILNEWISILDNILHISNKNF